MTNEPDKVPSPFPYEQIMIEVAKFQGERAAIIILENTDGSSTYLRHRISKENAIAMLRQAYQQ